MYSTVRTFCISTLLLASTLGRVSASHNRRLRKVFPWFPWTKHRLHHLSGNSAAVCVDLANQDTFYTVDLQVGTPAQTVTAVVDTGSRPLVIESCSCKASGTCSLRTKCFTGANVSSTFSVANFSNQTPVTQLSYGSGDILTAIGTDVVRMGSLNAKMDSNLFVMFANMMSFDPADGILGLAPRCKDPLPNLFSGAYTDQVPLLVEGLPPFQVPSWRDQGFFEAAGIDRFSLCLNSASGGALRLNVPELSSPMTSITTNWWGLGLWGISAGNHTTPIEVCTASSLVSGQIAPCTAIPDSGTTFLLAPDTHIDTLFSGICQTLPRCSNALAKRSGGLASDVFQELLFNCSDWIPPSKDISEVPSLNLQLAGTEGPTHLNTIELEPSTWIFESAIGDAYLNAHPSSRIQALVKATSRHTACSAAIASSHEPSPSPLWILGLPLFARYALSFDISNQPGQISFDSTLCTSCHQQGALFSRSEHSTIRKHSAMPLQMHRFEKVD